MHLPGLCQTPPWPLSHTSLASVLHLPGLCHTPSWPLSHTSLAFVKHLSGFCQTPPLLLPYVLGCCCNISLWTTSRRNGCWKGSVTLLGSVPSLSSSSGRLWVVPSRIFLKSSRGCPLLLRRVGLATVTLGRLPSPATSKVSDLPRAWFWVTPSMAASKMAL